MSQYHCKNCDNAIRCTDCGVLLSHSKDRRKQNNQPEIERRKNTERRKKCHQEHCEARAHYTLIGDRKDYCVNCWEKYLLKQNQNKIPLMSVIS